MRRSFILTIIEWIQRVGKSRGENYTICRIVEHIEDEARNAGERRKSWAEVKRSLRARLKERVNIWPRRRFKISVNGEKKEKERGRFRGKRKYRRPATKDGAYFYHQSWFVIEFDYHSQL